mgnify:CR=1 FL=1
MILWGHRIRLIIVMCVILLFFTGIVIRLHQLQIIKHDFFVSYAEKRHTKNLKLYPQRGAILDRTGKKILANTRRTKSIFVNPSIINNHEKTKDIKIIINCLSETLNLDRDIVTKRISAKTANGKFACEVMLLRKPTDEQLSRLEEFLRDSSYFLPEELNSKNKKENFLYEGIYFKDRDERIYPAGKTLCHTIGFMRDEERPGTLLIRDDINPQRGLELSFNEFLSGKEGWRIAEIDKRRIEVVSHETKESPAVNGYNLILSIDLNIQDIVEKEIEKASNKVEFESCSAIVMDPYTGEILAMASYPNFDPNKITEISDIIIANHAIETHYEPGSTLKPFTGCIALEKNLVTLDTLIDCEGGRWRIPGPPLHDAHGYGVLSFKEVIEKSSNIGIAKVGLLVGEQGVYENLLNFGFGRRTGIPLEEEKPGFVWPLDKWSKRSIYMLPMGQEISVTSLQLINAFCAIANGGNLMKPLLVLAVEDENHIPIQEYKPEVIRRVLSKETTDKMKIALSDVVSESGTARLADIIGYTEAGKTGTAQKVIDGRYSDRIFDSTFVGFTPVDNPRVAILIAMNGTKKPNHYGGTVAGPVFSSVGEQVLKYLQVPFDAPEELTESNRIKRSK